MKPLSKLITDQNFVKKVQYVMIALFVVIIGLDIYLALDAIDGNTISNVIRLKTDNGVFVLTYFWGAIAANLFFSTKKHSDFNGTIGSIIVVLIAILFIIFNVEKYVDSYFVAHQYNISIYSLSMAFGLIIGLLFWKQKQ